MVRGSITGADASGMTRAPKSWRGVQWRVNPDRIRPAPIQRFPVREWPPAYAARRAMPWLSCGRCSRSTTAEALRAFSAALLRCCGLMPVHPIDTGAPDEVGSLNEATVFPEWCADGTGHVFGAGWGNLGLRTDLEGGGCTASWAEQTVATTMARIPGSNC